MIPKRFQILRPYVASFIHSRFPRPPFAEVLNWLVQPGKEDRMKKFVGSVADQDKMHEIWFKGLDKPFYYPKNSRWIDLCQTVDECMNAKNWHHFITKETPISQDDIVVDCGAAEGLFSYVSAFTAQRVYAIEPVPSWHSSLDATFSNFPNVTVLKCGVGHKCAQLKMTNDEIFSKLSSKGEIEVNISTLDALLGNNPVTFLKADIEGYEFSMLLGAENIITVNRPKIALTVYHDGNDFLEIKTFLKDIHPDYRFRTRGIAANGNPVLLLAY